VADVGGMPSWSVDEPWINTWLHDEPLAYRPAVGPAISFRLDWKQRDEVSGVNTGVFNFGNGWNSSWLSCVYLQGTDTPTLAVELWLPQGGVSHFEFNNGWATNYYNNFRLNALTNSSGAVTNYTLFKPDGSKIIYDFFRTDSYGNWGDVFMTRQVDPQGHALLFQYPNYDPDIPTASATSPPMT